MNGKKITAAAVSLGLVSQFALMSFADSWDSWEDLREQVFNGDISWGSLTSSEQYYYYNGTYEDTSGSTEAEELEVEDDDDDDSSGSSSSSSSSDVEELAEGVVLEGDTVVVDLESLTTENVLLALETLLENGGNVFEIAAAVSEDGAVVVPMSNGIFAALAEAGVDLSIPSEVGNMTIGGEAMSAILEQLGSANVEIALASLDNSEALNEAQLEAVGDKPAIQFSINGLADFGGAAVSLEMAYKLPSGVRSSAVVTRAIDEEGTTEDMETVYSSGYVSFGATKSAIFFVDNN